MFALLILASYYFLVPMLLNIFNGMIASVMTCFIIIAGIALMFSVVTGVRSNIGDYAARGAGRVISGIFHLMLQGVIGIFNITWNASRNVYRSLTRRGMNPVGAFFLALLVAIVIL